MEYRIVILSVKDISHLEKLAEANSVKAERITLALMHKAEGAKTAVQEFANHEGSCSVPGSEIPERVFSMSFELGVLAVAMPELGKVSWHMIL